MDTVVFNDSNLNELAMRTGINLVRLKWTVAAVESATGGLIAELISRIPGSSAYFSGSITAYRNDIKINLLGIKPEALERYGAVSPQIAEGMALAGVKLFKADICIADTGIAGPGGATPEKPVGLFYIGLANKCLATAQRFQFRGDRRENRLQAAGNALIWLNEYLESLSP